MRTLNNIPKPLTYTIVGLIWLLIWHLISLGVNNEILLCSPLAVLQTLATNIGKLAFWSTILYTLVRILAGFFAALLVGFILAMLSWRFKLFETFLVPAVTIIKSVPIVCFIVLLLLWFGSPYVGAIAVFLVAFPLMYSSMVEGLRSHDPKLEQMLRIFNVPFGRKLLAFHWQTMLPFLVAGSRVGVGMSWKSGIAAELIGLPLGSIGERIYQSKILLSSAELFAWTIVIVIAALLCEKGFLRLLSASGNWLWKAALPKPKALAKAQGVSGQDSDQRLKQRLLAHGVSKSFESKTVVDNFYFDFKPSSRTMIKSASGGGKTTLLLMLAKLLAPSSGQIENAGKTTMVFQEARLFEQRSAVENVQLVAGLERSNKEIRTLLARLLPEASLDLPASQLSGGMRRRLELCRALAVSSDVVLLDEPFAGLDAKSCQQAYDFINQELGGRILIMASHDENDARALNTEIIKLAETRTHEPS
ncbi:MAG: ATP-binding cassette domain-containing protein [Coriobacteriia bacterium]|nr:ATP-binding cassette domain-containing protein [Coriobacteriia bacterium]